MERTPPVKLKVEAPEMMIRPPSKTQVRAGWHIPVQGPDSALKSTEVKFPAGNLVTPGEFANNAFPMQKSKAKVKSNLI
jgi:hypothetical protein